MHVQIQACICMHSHAYIDIDIHINILLQSWTYECQTCIHASKCAGYPAKLAYIHTYIHTYRHSYIHTVIHTYIHTYIHSYTHTYMHTLATQRNCYIHMQSTKYMQNKHTSQLALLATHTTPHDRTSTGWKATCFSLHHSRRIHKPTQQNNNWMKSNRF
jgi:hypothetical protein